MPLSTALYYWRKNNRYRNMPNVERAETTSATNVQIKFNQDITASNYSNGWVFIVDKSEIGPSGASPSGNDIVNFTMSIPIVNGQSVSFQYKRLDGSYLGQRGEIMQSSTGNVFNLV
ncbi:MAG: hypothetical protein R3250_00075 [Melioribacteraceae bacterium]|nr:hypothetical protein [Melioribacteraceae bacterium]